MSNPAFIVDGFTELKIIQNICPGRPVKRTDCNGKDVELEAIAKKIALHIRLLGNRYYPIIILVDKENRNISFEEMAEQLRQKLIEEGITDQDLRIGVADRMIENWILADWERFTGSINNKPDNTDGNNPTTIIKRFKKTFDKTTDGVEYFLNGRPDVMYLNSNSFRHFVSQLDGVECNYIDFEK